MNYRKGLGSCGYSFFLSSSIHQLCDIFFLQNQMYNHYACLIFVGQFAFKLAYYKYINYFEGTTLLQL